MARLALSAVGIAIAVAVLMVAASVGTMSDNRAARQAADQVEDQPIRGVQPTYLSQSSTQFRDDTVEINLVAGSAPDSPKPAAMPRLPRPGEMYASPALVELLRSDAGELLRPRLPEKIIGTLDTGLVSEPRDLEAWVGVPRKTVGGLENGFPVYRFGTDPPTRQLDASLLSILLIGAVVLLLPVFIFVASASRIAGAERDRRLAALRLVGSGSRQVRRIAAAESLVSAFAGLLLGTAVFLVGRQFAGDVDLFGEGVYVHDVVPSPVLAVLVVLLIPALAVLTALFALRRTIIEPLGVVRQSKPMRRRAWWRLALIVLGVVLMTTQLGAEKNTDGWAWAVTGGAALLLVGVPVLLPWLIERVAGRLRGGPSSWLLAIRRLQLDSGTSARVVGGVAVVLAGAIALQTVLMSVEGQLALPGATEESAGAVEVSAPVEFGGEIERKLAVAEGVTDAHQIFHLLGYEKGELESSYNVAVLDCAALSALGGVRDCVDGDVFRTNDQYQPTPVPGTELEWRQHHRQRPDEWDPADYTVTGRWTVPADAEMVTLTDDAGLYSPVLATPGAVAATTFPEDSAVTVVAPVRRDLTSDQLEGIRNAVADRRFSGYVYSYDTGPDLNTDQRTFVAIRTGLYAGSVFTLLLAGISLLVLALEHIRERRRQLAILTASGVPRGVLARSLLWQVALPIGLGVVVALVTGLGLGTLVLRLTDEVLVIDWPGVALLCAGAIALSLLVSAMTMPFLRRATRLTALRTE
jgi:hypothetical protein